MNGPFSRLGIGIVLGALAACSSSTDTASPGGGGDASSGTTPGDAQTPPTTNQADVEAWLATGQYKAWHCESAVHEARSPSIHGFNRICSNAIINAGATSTAAWPKGAAAVKELYNAATDTAPSGYAVYVKTAADSAAGQNWYWFEKVPAGTVYADGMGADICVSCHTAAGTDSAHTPSPGGHDFVYTPIP